MHSQGSPAKLHLSPVVPIAFLASVRCPGIARVVHDIDDGTVLPLALGLINHCPTVLLVMVEEEITTP